MTNPAPTIASVPLDSPILGIISVIVGVSIFSIQDAIIKGLSGGYPVHQIVFVRSLVALPLLFLVALAEGGGTLRSRRLGLHVLRGVTMFLAYTAYYLALAALPIAETVALYYTVPLFVAALSVPFLGERVGSRRWAAIAVGFLGVLVIVRPGQGLADPAAFLAVAAAVAYAMSALLARRLGATDGAGAMALSATLFYLAASGVMGAALSGIGTATDSHDSLRFLLNPWLWPSVRDFVLMAACGLVSALGFFFLAQGYRLAQANVAAPFEYVALPWAVLWGYLFFGNLPDIATGAGATIIVTSGLYVLYRERRRRPERAIVLRDDRG